MSLYRTSRRTLLALAGVALTAPALAMTRADVEDGVPEKELTAATMAGKKLRVVGPNMMMTMDYSEDRVNIEVDAQNIIKRVFIG